MDDYAFSYVTHDNDNLGPPSRKATPEPVLLVKPKHRTPPKATVRSRADSFHASKRPLQSIIHDDTTDYAKLDRKAWYAEVDDSEDEVKDLGDSELKAVRNANIAQLASCRKLLDHATTVLQTLDSIKNGFDAVSEQTSTLQTSCSDLQAEELRLSTLADNVREALQPFSYLAIANKLLNVPGSDLVLLASYQDLLTKLQSSLDFLEKHPDYKDAEYYTRQYRQSLTKALTLARVHFVASMRDVSADINNRIQVNAMNKNTQSALLYTKFRSIVNHTRPLMKNIEDASVRHEEYWSLLNDCWLSYFGIRRSLLSTMITTAFKELATITDFASFTTSAISFMRILALDEKELFTSFFVTGRDEFTTYLASLGQAFTDALRPRIAAESSLSVLCEVCSSMQSQCSQYAEDEGSVVFDMSPILKTTLGEIQSRIVLRAQGVVINEIQGYKPSERDLNYPGALRRHRGSRPDLSMTSSTSNLPVAASNGGSRSSIGVEGNDMESLNSAVVHEKWYVTLRVSISLLSKIYKLVQSSIFDDLAHEVVRSCIASLLHASNLIKRRNPLDGYLFLLKHLIILKDQLAAFDIEYSDEKEEAALDLSTVTGAFWDLTNRSPTELFAPSALYNLASSTLSKLSAAGYLSRKVENMSDARDELDDQTRLVIGNLTLYCADQVTVPLRSSMGSKQQLTKDLKEANRKFRAGCPDSIALWKDSFTIYLDDERAVDVLLSIVQDKILETYERFDNYVSEIGRQKAKQQLAKVGEVVAVVEGEQQKGEGVALPSLMETVDWIRGITKVEGLADVEE